MTLSSQLTKRIYTGNGTTREWDIDFPLVSANDLHIYITSPGGEETTVTENFEFDAEHNKIIYPLEESGHDPLPDGWKITLVRQTPLTQEIDLMRQGEWDAEVLEGGYDKLTMLLQELSEKVDRSIKYPVSVQPSSAEAGNFLHEILSAKQAALTASNQAASAAQTASTNATAAAQSSQTAVAAIQSATQTGQETLTTHVETLSAQLAASLGFVQQAAETAQYYAEHALRKNIGEVYYSQSSSAEDNRGALPLFTGDTITTADELYPDFYAWVADHTDLQISSADYETALSTYGECPKYVIDTVNKTIRLPKLTNYVKMANTTDKITQSAAGLPDHSHTVTAYDYSGSGNDSYFYKENGNTSYTLTTDNASVSNPIYGNSNTVTPAHTTLYPWVFAYKAGEVSDDKGWVKPADWVDIRSGAVANSIYLLVAHPADYSQYDYLAFTANVSNSGTYDVYIDGVKYNTFSSGSNAEIQWSVLNLSTGYDVTYPSALHTHIVRITPTSTSNTLTKYTLVKHSSLTANTNYYGILWLHFTLTNSIDLRHNLLSYHGTVSLRNLLAEAVTSANGKITTANEIAGWFYLCSALKTVPLIESTQSNANMTRVFEGCSSLKTISLKGVKFFLVGDVFKDCTSLTEIKLEGSFGTQNSYRAYSGCTKLKAIPNTDFSGSVYCDDFIKNATSLGPTFLDLSAASTMTNFGAKGDSTHFISGIKGIVVSSSAPFNGPTSPRLNLAYTGLDRIALVTLFNSMPTVSDSQVCNITGCTGASSLTAEDLAIATNKGWTITR